MNKRDISTVNSGYPHLTLKEGPKVKSDHIKRFPAHDFLEVDLVLWLNANFGSGFQMQKFGEKPGTFDL